MQHHRSRRRAWPRRRSSRGSLAWIPLVRGLGAAEATVAPAYDSSGDPPDVVTRFTVLPMRTADSVARGARSQPFPAWTFPLVLAVVAIVLRMPAFLSSRHLLFDDGVYGVSVIDMRRGLAPYSGVFSSQGPLHFPLLYIGDLLGFRTINSPRVTPVVMGVVASIGAWAIARRCAARETVALVAGLLVATTGTMLWTTGQITGDGPATALAVCAVWAAVVHRDDPKLGRAVITGIAMGAAIAVKPLAVTAAIPVGWWLLSPVIREDEPLRRRFDHVAVAALAALATGFRLALPS